MKFEQPIIPESVKLFADEFAILARKNKLKHCTLNIRPDFGEDWESKYMIHGDISIVYNGVDGRGRPEDSLEVSIQTNQKLTLK